MPHILISYRRDDSDAIAGRIRDRVANHFGEDCVFMDIDSIPFGTDFRKQVQGALMENDIVLAIIGPKWTGGGRGSAARIQDEADPVRLEIETALQHGIPIVPILVGKATMPKAADLPESLRDLPYLNAAEVSAGRDFTQQIERLLRSIERILGMEKSSQRKEAESDAAKRQVATRLDDDRAAGDPEPKHPGLKRQMVKCGLLLANPELERAFIESFRTRLYFVGQTSMLFGIVAWVAFGMTDLLSGVAGLRSIQFRFMFAMPLMVLFFGLSFTRVARRFWQSFFAMFAVVGVTCMSLALILVGPESWFRVEQATMSFMLFMAMVGLAPFTTIYTVGVGLFIVLVHGYFVVSDPQLPAPHALFYSLFVATSYLIICATAWVRESTLRSAFVAKARVADKEVG